MLKVKISVGANVFEFEGEAPFEELRTLLALWFTAIDAASSVTQAEIDTLTARVAAATDGLKVAVDRSTPQS